MIYRTITKAILVCALCFTTSTICGAETVIFQEDFEDVELQDSIAEAVEGTNVWSDTPPEGWEITNVEPRKKLAVKWAEIKALQ